MRALSLSFLRPKGHLSKTERWVLGILAGLPLLSILLRTLALPGIEFPGFGLIARLGLALTDAFSLSAVAPDQREQVLHLLVIPTGALLVAVVRLTLGIRVLGFRSILIAVGFHHSGIGPSLLLITVAVATIVLVRPHLRRMRLPYYARVSVILCIVATTMVGAVMVGPWMRSDILWGVAYFPVIVLGMLSEGVARTVDRQDVVTASWRAITTVSLAFVIALIGWLPALRSLLLQFPELLLTEIVAIVAIAEYLDLHLYAEWERRVSARLMPLADPSVESSRIAVVRNRPPDATPDGKGPQHQPQALRSVQKIVDALRNSGHTVSVIEGDRSLIRKLRRFLAPGRAFGAPPGIVLNLAEGTGGEAPVTHVPAMLEMAGIPYVGPTPRGHAMTFDRLLARTLMQEAGIPTPAFRVLARPDGKTRGLQFPMEVRPRHDPGTKPKMARNRRALRKAVRRLTRTRGQEAIVEERVSGRRISVALIGNHPLRCLPLVELDAATGEKHCPAVLDEALAKQIRKWARAAFRACGCRDYARVDVRVGESGEIRVSDVRTHGILASQGAFVLAGTQAGYRYERLISRIVEVAWERQHGAAAEAVGAGEAAPAEGTDYAANGSPGLHK